MNAIAETTRQQYAEDGGSDLDRLLNKPFSPTELLLDDRSFDRIMRIAELMAAGRTTVPKHLQNNIGDCAAVVTQAFQWGMNPFAVAQKTHLVNGTLGYEAQLVNAVVQQSGAIRGHFHYEYRGEGNSLECRAGAILRGDTEITWGEFLNVNAPQTKNSPLWKVNPKQQLGYLQVKNWARAYAPGAILGVYTEDELDDLPPPAGLDAAPAPGPRRKSEKAASPAPTPSGADPTTGEVPPPPPAAAAAPKQQTNTPAQAGAISAGQVAYLRNKLKAASVEEASICDRFQVTGIELLSAEQFDTVKAELLSMG